MWWEAFAFFLAALLVWFWVESLRAREDALHEAMQACEREGLQFLDAAIACISIRLARDEHGRMGVRRTYRFEFSDNRYNRREGTVVLQGGQVIARTLDPFLIDAE
jgi:hypothetical protein